MKAVAAQNTRVKDPVYHVVLSWPAMESPNDGQAFECGRHALAAIGMSDHQYVFAIHRDTDNVHLHIAVNRVNPDSFVAVYPDRDYYKLDRAMRELELRFGWSHDKGPCGVFERNGKTVIDWSSTDPNTKGKRPAAAADMERHADQESFFSYVRGKPRKALMSALRNDALTWPQLHNLLAKHGLQLREKGQGLAIYDLNSADTTPIKASDMHEGLSKGHLTKRLGPFEAAEPSLPAPAAIAGYDKHRPPKRDPEQREQRRQERAEARRDLRARYDAYKTGFVLRRLDPGTVRERFTTLRQEARRQRIGVRTTVTDPAVRKAMYSIIAFETVRARHRLQREVRRERAALRAESGNRRGSYREWVEQYAATGDAAAISQLRGFLCTQKRQIKDLTRALGNDGMDGIKYDEDVDPIARELGNGFQFHVRRDGSVAYRDKDGAEGFVDLGRRIEVLAKGHDGAGAIAAALAFAADKYGDHFELTGSEQFKRHAIEIMVNKKISVRLKNNAQAALRRAQAAELAKQTKANQHGPKHLT